MLREWPKTFVKAPQRRAAAPSIVEEKRIQGGAALVMELAAKCIYTIERSRIVVLVVLLKVTGVVTRVVMQKWLVATLALAFDRCEECAAELAGLRGAEHRHSDDRLAKVQRKIANQRGGSGSSLYGAARKWILNSKKHVGIHDR
jgi:hypothetical protein